MATVNLSAYDKNTIPSAEDLRVGIAVSRWNTEITEGLYNGAAQTLFDLGAKEENVFRVDVPGSFELIYAASAMQASGRFDAVIVLGSIIRGETPHFEYICSSVAGAIASLNTRGGKKGLAPVVFGVLTDNNIDQARARSGGALGNKGVECAVDAVQMAALKEQLRGFKL